MKNKTTIKQYVKPNAFCMQISPCSMIAASGTEGYKEKDGEGTWTSVDPNNQ